MLHISQQLMETLSGTSATDDEIDDRLKSYTTSEMQKKYQPSEYKMIMFGIFREFNENPCTPSQQQNQKQLMRATDRVFDRMLKDYASKGGEMPIEELRQRYDNGTDRERISLADNLMEELALMAKDFQ